MGLQSFCHSVSGGSWETRGPRTLLVVAAKILVVGLFQPPGWIQDSSSHTHQFPYLIAK